MMQGTVSRGLRQILIFVLVSMLFARITPLRAEGGTVEVRVMTFNVWLGGDVVNLGQVAEAIRAAKADIVGIQEIEGNLRRVADLLGWPYANERMQIISRFPLIDPPDGNGIYIFAALRPGAVMALANVHLPSDPYGPEAVRDGSTAADVLKLEKDTRLPAIEKQLAVLPKLVKDGIPVVLTGDFNSPSYLDWTAEMVKARQQVRYPLEWPVSKALADAGFQDSYRQVYPDPTKRAGLTWTPGNPDVKPNETLDRIDFVFTAGNVTAKQSQIVAEANGPDVDIAVTPWPSDHRAVVSTLSIEPATPPVFIAADHRLVRVGDALTARFHAPGKEGERIVVVRAKGDSAAPLMSLSLGESTADGSVTLGTGLLEPGEYEVALVDSNGSALSRSGFSLLAKDAVPSLDIQSRFTAGEPIVVNWQNAPGNRWDWLGIYKADEFKLDNYLAYIYTDATIKGSKTLDATNLTDIWPLEPGEYKIMLLRDDGYVVLASANFTITK